MSIDSKEVLEGNKIIAESPFASDITKEWIKKWVETNIKLTNELNADINSFPYHTLKYNTSWDWLMPVIENIKVSGDYSSKHYLYNHGDKASSLISVIDSGLTTVDIETAWLAVVSFIQWYNQNNKS